MRHRSGSSTARPAGPGGRSRHRATERHPSGRWGRGLAVVALVTGFLLAAPVVSGRGTVSAPTPEGALVVMGLDGRPTSATFASAAASLAFGEDGNVRVETTASRGERTAAAPRTPSPAPPAAPASMTPSRVAPSPEPVVPAPVAAAPRQTTASPARPAPATTPAPRATLPAATAPLKPAAVPAGSDRAAQVLALVNEERAAAGCRPLSADSRLAAVADAHSADMRDRGFFDHVNLDGLSPFDRADAAGVSARAENIARGQADAAAVMTSWMASAGHRANVLDCGLTRLGVGIADGGGGPWWTQLFA